MDTHTTHMHTQRDHYVINLHDVSHNSTKFSLSFQKGQN